MELMSVLLVVFFIVIIILCPMILVFFVPEIKSIGKFWSIIIGLALTCTLSWWGLVIYFLIYLFAIFANK